ncbi:6-hydroxynicotinate 3-monooxygenase [Morella rubra]|uniref:6-hydroxynicotinate 3-monooxygenase n=1 Tax=Morella rubra TaxID=262757 RepID=A0A6A1W7D6_9ROSI|nr:6-hydroxynicotinate 3-monooxygenase [Morella rubra]
MEVVEDIVIVGAGIAGLTTSLGLHRNMTTSTISGLQTSEISFEVEGQQGNHEVRCVQRKLLLEALANELPSGTIRYSSKVVSIEESGFYKLVHLADGTILKTKGKPLRVVSLVQRRITKPLAQSELPVAPFGTLPSVPLLFFSCILNGTIKPRYLYFIDVTIWLSSLVLIGCDGVNSVVARWLHFDNPAFTGRSAIRGCVNFKRSHGFGTKFMQFFGLGVRSGFIPCDDKTVYWFFTWTPSSQEKAIERNPAEMKQFVLSKLGKMPDEVRAIIENTELDSIISSPLRYRSPWELLWGNISKGNVCVAGDALHPMTPDIGQGGCAALEDGVILARCLAEAFLKEPSGETKGGAEIEREREQYKRIEMGLKKYAKERRWRSIELISTAYMVGSVQQANGQVMNFVRDKMLACISGWVVVEKG